MLYIILFFFFSSRRRHTRFDCDWSSDVCSSDLEVRDRHLVDHPVHTAVGVEEKVCVLVAATITGEDREDEAVDQQVGQALQAQAFFAGPFKVRSEERRVGKECRSRWAG